jgi:hypothetical protein
MSNVTLNKTAQHFIEFRGMLSEREMAGAVEDVHPRIGCVAGNQIEQRVALIDGCRGVVIGPRQQRRDAKPRSRVMPRVSSFWRERCGKNCVVRSPASSIFFTASWYFGSALAGLS